jgi:hypothetical protein
LVKSFFVGGHVRHVLGSDGQIVSIKAGWATIQLNCEPGRVLCCRLDQLAKIEAIIVGAAVSEMPWPLIR